jgi:hypothetical protein
VHQRDYILRHIEQLGAALISLRNLILGRKADPARVEEEMKAVAGQGGMEVALLRGFTEDTLYMFVTGGGELEPARCWLMAELLYLDGLQAQLEKRDLDAEASLKKARMLFTLIEPAGGMLVGIPEAAGRVDEIDEHLDELA